jgi:hypothetical protein
MQIEVQQQISDYLLPSWFMDDSTPPVNRSGCLNQYCELDAHWERYVKSSSGTESVITNFNEEGKSHRQHISDHGIKQNVTVERGNYILIFDYRGRPGVKNTFKVWVESASGSTDLVTAADIRPSGSPTPPTTAEVSTTAWKRAMVSFKVEGGNATGNQIALKFDLEDPIYDADSYGAFIDNVILRKIKMDLDVDTDRDGSVEDNDEDDVDEDNWTTAKGAIYNVNFDRDGSRTKGGTLGAEPRPDAIHFEDDGSAADEDYVIENTDDEKDIASLVIRKIGSEIPYGWKVYLKVAELEDIQRIHVYKKIKAEAANTAIWGTMTGAAPATELDITQWVDPNGTNFQGDATSGDATFGIEGLCFRNDGISGPASQRFDGYIDLTIELRDGATVISSDSVRLKVAPWIILNHEQASQEIWVLNHGADNDEFRNNTVADPGYKGLDDSGLQFKEFSSLTNPKSYWVSQWFQDHIQFGFTQRPGGPKTHMVFRMPYDYEGTSNPTWPVWQLLKKDVGTFTLGNDLGANSGDYGGNLEALPATTLHQLGRICMGDRSFPSIQQFLTSQEVQVPFFNLPVRWLVVGHIDEVTSFLGGGKVALADPTQAWTLIADATKIPAADRHKALFFATGATPEGGEVGAAVGNRLYDGPATGQIITVGEANLVDGESFTIMQDATIGKTFEFNLIGAVAAGNIAIDLTGAGVSTAGDVRDLIIAAVNGSGLTVQAIDDGAATVHFWNTTKGVAGNQAITETVAHAGFTRMGMSGGKAGGRDFTATAWNYVRTFTYTAGAMPKPDKGRVAHISGRHDGWIEIDQVWHTTSKVIGGSAPEEDIMHWSETPLPPTLNWGVTLPKADDKYAVCVGTRFWKSGATAAPNEAPAIVSVEEVLADTEFEALNKTDVQGELNTIKANMNAAAGGGLTFISLPNLFFGRRAGFAAGKSSVAFNPGPTNLQPLAGKRYVPRQFGPRTSAGGDIYEEEIRTALGAGTQFVDCWDLYHRLLGEVHCGSEVKRDFPGVDWWTKIP